MGLFLKLDNWHLLNGDTGEQVDAVQEGMMQAEKGRKGCESTVNTNVNLDGKKIAKNQARHKTEIDERSGFKAQPYQRRQMTEQGFASGR